MNCKKCGKEILDEKSGFCANCGVSFNLEHKNSDFLANAGLLSFIAAAFSVTLGVVGVVSYQSFVEYYSYYGYSTAGAIGFLFITGLAFAASALGLVSGALSLTKKRFKIVIIGPVLLIVSGILTFAIEYLYQLGYSDGQTVPAVPMIVLSVVGLVLLVKSKKAFVDYRAPVEAPEDIVPPEVSAEEPAS